MGSAAPAGSTGADACHFSLAMRYELTREDYQIAAKRMQEAISPYKTARDAMTTAISSYMESTYEAGGGKGGAASSTKGGKSQAEGGSSKKAYWEAIYKKQKKGGTSPQDADAASRGRDADAASRGRGAPTAAEQKSDEARRTEERRAVEKEEKKLVEVAASRMEKKEAKMEELRKKVAEAQRKAEQRYEDRVSKDARVRLESAKKVAAEEKEFRAAEKAKLAKTLLLEAKRRAVERMHAEESKEQDEQEHGRSSQPLFRLGKQVSVASHCGGTAGDGSLDEECGEEPTGDAPRKEGNSNSAEEFPWAQLLSAKAGRSSGL